MNGRHAPTLRGRSKDPSFPQKAEEPTGIDALRMFKPREIVNKAVNEVRLLDQVSQEREPKQTPAKRAGKRFLTKRQLFPGSTAAFRLSQENAMAAVNRAPCSILRMPRTATWPLSKPIQLVALFDSLIMWSAYRAAVTSEVAL
jgi:hypothetical protein